MHQRPPQHAPKTFPRSFAHGEVLSSLLSFDDWSLMGGDLRAMVGDSRTMVFSGLRKVFIGL